MFPLHLLSEVSVGVSRGGHYSLQTCVNCSKDYDAEKRERYDLSSGHTDKIMGHLLRLEWSDLWGY